MEREYWSVAGELEVCEYCRRLISKGEKVWREVDDTPGFRENFIYCERCGKKREELWRYKPEMEFLDE